MIKKSLKDSYKLYVRNVKNPVNLKTYLLITSIYNKFIINKVLEGNEVTLPSRMGTLCIIGRKQKIRYDENGKIIGLAPDWVKTKKLWDTNPKAKEKKQLVYHTNLHSDNTRYKYLWSKCKVLAENKTIYALRMARVNKRAVYKLIKQGKQYTTKY